MFQIQEPDCNHKTFREPQRLEPVNTRPLGSLSGYVVDLLPKELAHVRSGILSPESLAANVEVELDRAQIHARQLTRAEARLGLLDTMMLWNGLTAMQTPIPAALDRQIEAFASALGELPWLTYDLIVRTNPCSDIRTFTGSESERDFYRYHERIEQQMTDVLAAMRSICEIFDRNRLGSFANLEMRSDIALHIRQAESNLNQTFKTLGWFAKLPAEAFNSFRHFFIEQPGKPGASGLFSGHMQAFSIILAGSKLGPALDRVANALAYYPSRDRETLRWVLDRAHRSCSLLDDLSRSDAPAELRSEMVGLFECERNFLTIHRAAIRRTIKEVYDANAPGTGGQQVKTFIDRTIDMYAGIIEQLKKSSTPG